MSDELDRIAEELAFHEELPKTVSHVVDLEGEARNSPDMESGVSQVDVDWLMFRDELKDIKAVSRSLEMDIDRLVPSQFSMQFCDDVEMYGLYEAVMLVPDKKAGNAVKDAILVELRLSKLPKKDIRTLKDFGVVLPDKKKGLRPESIWALQKHLILDFAFDKRVEQVFDSVLPFSCPPEMPRPHTSQDFQNVAMSTSVWYAVTQVPIKYREALAQRLLVMFQIPDPEPPKNSRQHIVRGVEQKPKDRVLVIDKAGNAWTWSCGWFRVGEDGQRLDDKLPLGHAAFRRRIIPAGPEDYAKSSFRYTRPWGQWRRGNGPVYHALFGNGVLILTDGMHAVVEFADGIKREVVLDNLQSISVKSHRPAATQTKEAKTKSPKKASLPVSLEEMLKML